MLKIGTRSHLRGAGTATPLPTYHSPLTTGTGTGTATPYHLHYNTTGSCSNNHSLGNSNEHPKRRCRRCHTRGAGWARREERVTHDHPSTPLPLGRDLATTSASHSSLLPSSSCVRTHCIRSSKAEKLSARPGPKSSTVAPRSPLYRSRPRHRVANRPNR